MLNEIKLALGWFFAILCNYLVNDVDLANHCLFYELDTKRLHFYWN